MCISPPPLALRLGVSLEDLLRASSGLELIATSAKQIGMFLVILAIVSAAIVAFIIYTLTMDKIGGIAVLKLIGTAGAYASNV